MTWARLRIALGLALAATGAVGACGYPNFTYGPGGTGGQDSTTTSSSSTSTQGGGGMGGESSSRTAATIGPASSSSSSSAGSGGGGGTPHNSQVPCVDGSLCAVDQICCFNYSLVGCDECLDIAKTCGNDIQMDCGGPSQYGRYNCNTNADCNKTAGEVCCMNLGVDQASNILATAASCSDNCQIDVATRIACAVGSDCPDSEACQPVDFDYPGYGYCGDPAN